MIGRTNCGAGGGGKRVVTIRSAYGSTVSWSGTDTGSVTMADSSSEMSATLKRGTYTFAATLELESETVTIYTKTIAITDNSTIDMYPDGAIYWYGLPVVSNIVKANIGTFTASRNYVDSTHNRSYSSGKSPMTKTIVPYDTTGKTTVHWVYRDTGSSRNVNTTRFFVQEDEITTAISSSAKYGTGNTQTREEKYFALDTLAGKSLYFGSAFDSFSSYSGGGICAHRIYAVWFE